MVKVFISSTGRDLHEYRQAAIETCNSLQFVPVAMEFFEAMGVGATEGSKLKLDQADVYVGIFAHRYGYIENGYDKAVTEIEFDYAGERTLDRLCYVVNPTYPWSPESIDYKNYERLKAFKAGIDQSLIRAQFTDVNDFRSKLMQALVMWHERQPKHPPLPEKSIEQPTVSEPSGLPTLPTLIVGREQDFVNLKRRLVGDGAEHRKPLTMIHGWPGVGKTTLVSALAYDKQVLNAFPDGVLWAAVGMNPDSFHALSRWGRQLGADMSHVTTLEEAMTQVRALLRNKKILLIVDDLWDIDAAAPYNNISGPDCATLMTTRFADVARHAATTSDDVYRLGILNEMQGVSLLRQLAPTVVNHYPTEIYKLVNDLEGLPLALRVAARLLDYEFQSGFDVSDSFQRLSDSSALLQEKAPEDRFDAVTGTTPTVTLLLKHSTDRLDEQSRQCYAFLGALAPKPATFDLNAMKAAWMIRDPKPIVLKLVDRGLLEPIPSKSRFWMHALLVAHAQTLLKGWTGRG